MRRGCAHTPGTVHAVLSVFAPLAPIASLAPLVMGSALAMGALAFTSGCSSFGAVYPPRPPATPGAPVADPTPSRIVAHVAVTSGGLQGAVDKAVPRTGDGSFSVLGSNRHYAWTRTPFEVSFMQGRVVLDTHVKTTIDLPISNIELPLDVHVVAEPVVGTEYKVKLQSTEVKVSSSDRRLNVADHVAGIYEVISGELGAKLKAFSYDLKPPLEEAYARVSKPIEIPIGDARGCAQLRVLGIEAGPTVLADGLEKDIALVVAPEVTMPCAAPSVPPPLPTFSNVPLVASGPFTVTVPIAARWEELARATNTLFTDGKYFFSAEFPKLYLEKPEVYESQGQIVLKVHLSGPVHKFGIDADLDGDLYLSGHLSVVDNEVRIPDLEPTIETKNFFLSLKAMADGDKIRDQARSALRLDLSERLKGVREKLSSDLTFGTADACFRGDLDKIEVLSAHAHGNYLRVYVAVTARAAATMPCSSPLPAAAAAAPANPAGSAPARVATP